MTPPSLLALRINHQLGGSSHFSKKELPTDFWNPLYIYKKRRFSETGPKNNFQRIFGKVSKKKAFFRTCRFPLQKNIVSAQNWLHFRERRFHLVNGSTVEEEWVVSLASLVRGANSIKLQLGRTRSFGPSAN